MKARYLWRWLLLPFYLAAWLYTGLRCDWFGWHSWRWRFNRPVYIGRDWTPSYYRHYQSCRWCGAENLKTQYRTREEIPE